MDNLDLKYIKKHYGEKMAKLCRELFPTILEEEGALSKIIATHFDNAPTLCDDIIENGKNAFAAYILGEYNKNKETSYYYSNKTPAELMELAGYDLFECTTQEEIDSFIKYYARGEELCTFIDDYRLANCRVWFAVKKDVDKIKREDFANPDRQDRYGTSVISIQFSKGNPSILSIKNRYNHAVNNPDATFSNNLNNIYPGLTDAFIRHYGIKMHISQKNQTYTLPNYLTLNGIQHKIIHKDDRRDSNKMYCCSGNIVVINNEVIEYSKDNFIVSSGFVIDLKNKKIIAVNQTGFVESMPEIKDIKVEKIENKQKKIIITSVSGENIILKLGSQNQLLSVYDNCSTEIDYNYLNNLNLEEVELSKVKRIARGFLQYSSVNKIKLSNLEYIGKNFLSRATVDEVELSNIDFIEENCLAYAHVKNFKLSNVDCVNDCLLNASYVDKAEINNVLNIEVFALFEAQINKLDVNNVNIIKGNFMYNAKVNDATINNVKHVYNSFGVKSTTGNLNCSNIKIMEHNFLGNATAGIVALDKVNVNNDRFLFNTTVNELIIKNEDVNTL